MRQDIDNNVKPGPLYHCQICGSKNLELVLDCGHQIVEQLRARGLKSRLVQPLPQCRILDI